MSSGDELSEGYDNNPPLPSKEAQDKASAGWTVLRGRFESSYNEDGTSKVKITARRSVFVSTLIYLDGKPFCFEGRKYLEPLYNSDYSEVLLKTARQVEKSTFLSNALVIDSVVKPFNKSLYVSPSHMQTRQFSSEKLKPILENSPLIRAYYQDSSVSQQVFEKGFSNGSFIFLRSAYRSADRTRGVSAGNLCLSSESCVYTKGRGVIKIKELTPGDEVLSSDIEKGKTVYSTVTKVWSMGSKDTLTITTESGKSIRLTPDHRLYSWNGWMEARDLSKGDYLLTEAPRFSTDNLLGREVSFLIGLLLGDGSIERSRNVVFRSTDISLIEKAKEAASFIDNDFTHRSYTKEGNLSKRLITEHHLCFKANGSMEILLKELGLLGLKNVDKDITFFNRIGKEEAIGLLSGLFVTDGCVCSGYHPENKSGPFFTSASFINTSLKLCKSVQALLSMLGINSQLRNKNPYDNGVSVLPQYTVSIRDVCNFKKFIDIIPMPTKEHQVDNARNILKQMPGQRTKSDLLPVTNKQLCNMLRDKLGRGGISKFQREIYPISSSNSKTSKGVISLVAEYLDDSELLRKINHEGRWEKIIKIEQSGECEVVDITVKMVHNLFVNGVSAHNCLDELQDFLIDQIPVIRECTSHFPDARTLFAGTPKSTNNPIEVYWKTTTQCEWMVPCHSCKHWNYLDDRNIAPTEEYTAGKLPPGPVCSRCKTPIDVRDGRWVAMSSKNAMRGFRIPQLMVPWICGIPSQWEKLLWKRDHYPTSQFYNEVLGISYDSSSSPITLDEVLAICGEHSAVNLDMLTSEDIANCRKMTLVAGVDWGEGLDGSEKSPSGKLRPASYTVFSIGGYHRQDEFKFIAFKKFTGKETDPEYIVKYITKACQTLGIVLCGVDWGHGWGVNNTLVRLLGPSKVVQFQHLPKLKNKMRWDPIGYRYHLHRNFMISEFFFDMKNRYILFPKWVDFEPFSKDFFSIYVEYSEYRREMKYDHRSSEPDDAFHSSLYCKLTADIYGGRTRRYTNAVANADQD